MNKPNLYPWEVISSQVILESNPWMKINVQQVRLPDGRVVDDYHNISIGDHVIIYAETEEGLVITERQYKHGVGRVSLTLPAGGILDGEEPLAAAERELLEETGYRAESIESLGDVNPNPALFRNRLHCFVARDVCWEQAIQNGEREETAVELVPRSELSAKILAGEIDSAPVLAAFHRLTLIEASPS